jgi:DHA1 family bicyclomycin/chloramphenicol resistance-like MFS transporter
MESLLAARTLQAAGGCVALVLPRAIVRDAFAGVAAARTMTLVTMAQSIVPALAPLLGGVLVALLDWRAVFLFCFAYGVFALAWTAVAYRETLSKGPPALAPAMPSIARFAALLRERNYVAYMLNAALLTVPYVVFLTVAPTLLIRGAELSAAEFGLYNLLLVASIVAGSITAARLSKRLAIERLVLAASLVAVASVAVQLLLADTLSLWRLLGPILIYIAAHAVLFPLAVASSIAAYPSMAATAAGFIGFAQTGLGSLVLLVIGQFDTATPYPAAALSFGAAAAGLASLALARRRRA